MTTITFVTAAWVALVATCFVRTAPPRRRDGDDCRPEGLRRPAQPRQPRRPPRLRLRPRPRPGRRRRRDHAAGIAEAVPDVIDLFAVAIAAGLNTRLALRAVAERAPSGVLADALRVVEHHITATGARLADAIERLPEDLDDEAVRPLVAAITDAERYGAALGPTLDRLADDARRSRQRRAEEAARRIPVKLLFPLVTCILPAFGLLTVAPLIAGGLRALRL